MKQLLHLTPVRALALALVALWLLVLLPLVVRAQAPTWQEAFTGNNSQPSTGTSLARATAVDASGNVFLTGSFSGQVTFGTTRLVGAGSSDVFIAKWDATAHTWAWAVAGGGTYADVGNAIAVSGGEIYVTGSVTNSGNLNTSTGTSVQFGGVPLYSASTTAGLNQDVFVARYTDGATPTYRWARTGGGTGADQGNGIAVSGSEIYLTGTITNNGTLNASTTQGVQFGGTPLYSASTTTLGNTDVFVARYTDGTTPTYRWAVAGGGTGVDVSQAIAVSGSEIYVTGSVSNRGTATTSTTLAVQFSGTPLYSASSTSILNTDTFVVRYTDGATPTYHWATASGGTGADVGYGVAVSGQQVYTAQTNGAALGSYGSVLAPPNAAILGQLSAGTGTWQRAEAPLQGTTSLVRATALDASGNVFVVGSFTGQVGFGTTQLVSAGSTDVFIAKWDATTHAWAWAVAAGGTGVDAAQAIAVSGGEIYVTGYVNNYGNLNTSTGTSVQFGGVPLYSASSTSSNTTDVFVARYTDGATPTYRWAVAAGGNEADAANGIAVSGGEIYLTGYVTNYGDRNVDTSQAVQFGGVPLYSASTISTSNNDVFVARYTDGATPTYRWAVAAGGTGADVATAIAVSGSELYVTGYVNNSGTSKASTSQAVQFGGVPLYSASNTSSNNADVFVARYTDGATPTYRWAVAAGGTGGDVANGIAVSGGEIYLTGYVTNSGTSNTFSNQEVQFGGVPFYSASITGTASTDVFVARYTDGPAPAYRWALAGGGTGADTGYGLAMSGSEAYVAGLASAAATFGSNTIGISTSMTSNFVGHLTNVSAAYPPVLLSLSASSGPSGTTLAASGNVLMGATAVTFTSSGNTATAAPAGYVVASSNSITGIVVPAGLAPDTYTVTVTTPTGTSNGLSFVVLGPPTITAVAPSPGGLGQRIALTGTSLGNPTAFTINGANALAGILSNDGSTLVVRVPLGAASTGTVSLTTALGTATAPFSVVPAPGNALAFDGADDYVHSAATLPATGEFTLEAWVNPSAFYNQLSALVLTDDFPAGAMHCQFYADKLGFTVNGNDPTDVVSTVALPLGRWAHVAVVYSASAQTVQFYIDGVLTTTGTYTTAGAIAATSFSVGAWVTGSGVERAFSGRIDELRLYSVALTQAQVQADRLSTAPSVPASLAYYLNFDQGTPATAAPTGANAGLTTLYDLATGAPATLTYFDLSSGNTTSNYVTSYALVVPTATGTRNATSTGFTANWAAPAYGTDTSYLIDVSATADFSQPVANSPFAASGTATSLAVSGLSGSAVYFYRVRALNSAFDTPDQGAYSNVLGTDVPLPVVLTQFAATAQGTAVRLTWATASEKNSARFDVERSADGATYIKVGTVAAAGTTATTHAYALLDAALPTGASVLYYRLRQVDLDGTFSYSPVRAVALAEGGLALFPNPARGSATLGGVQPGTTVQVLDALGRLVLAATADASGNATLALPAGLPGGVYVVRAGQQALRLAVE